MAAAGAEVSFTSARTVTRRDGLGRMGSRVGWEGKGKRETPLKRRREAMDEVLFQLKRREWGICFLILVGVVCRVSCVVCAYTLEQSNRRNRHGPNQTHNQ